MWGGKLRKRTKERAGLFISSSSSNSYKRATTISVGELQETVRTKDYRKFFLTKTRDLGKR
jgi:hypothetical protein